MSSATHHKKIDIFTSFDHNQLVDRYSRYQKNLKLHDLFPSIEGKCACGCGRELTGRQKRWASSKCCEEAYEKFAVLKGNVGMIRKVIFDRDEGFCRLCGSYDNLWEVDHVIEVREGGGACGLDNLQTLCPSCHDEKTSIKTKEILEKNVVQDVQTASHQRDISLQDASKSLTLLT